MKKVKCPGGWQASYPDAEFSISDTCIVKKPKHTHDFLYFIKADRRNTKNGDPFMGYYFDPAIKSVKY